MTRQMCIAMVGPASRTANYCGAHGICDVFVTLDRNLEFQQNMKVLSFDVVVVRSRSNRIKDLSPHISGILDAAIEVRQGQVMTVGA